MNMEVGADIATLFIFLILIIYVWRRRIALNIFIPMMIFVLGIFIVSISDILSLITLNPYVECIAGKFTAAGALISIVALLHAFSVFPTESKIYKLLPSAYIISGVLIANLFITPHLIYCHPTGGGTRGILWDTFLIWSYIILLIDAAIPGIRFFTLKIKVQKTQELLIFIGTVLALIYVGITQVIPHFVGGYDYRTSIFALPIMGIFYIYSTVKYGMFIQSPATEKSKKRECSVELGQGRIIAISNINAAFRVFRNLVSENSGMIITIKPPNYIKENYDFQKTPILWITYFSGNYRPSITPGRLHFEGMEAVINFVRKGGKILLFEGLEYLIANFDRKFIVEFLESLRNLSELKRVILAVQDVSVVEGLCDETHTHKCDIKKPSVIMTVKPPDCNMFLITTNPRVKCTDKSEMLLLSDEFTADRLIFEGAKYVEDTTYQTVYIESMDYIISVAGEKNAASFLKDVIDIIVGRGGLVYLKYTPLVEESPLLLSILGITK